MKLKEAYVYSLVFDNWGALIRVSRKLWWRKVKLCYGILIVRTPHWNKIKDLMAYETPRKNDIAIIIRRPTI